MTPNVVIGAGPSQAKIYGPDKRLHDLNKSRYIEILPDLVCRDQHTVFKYKINGVSHAKEKIACIRTFPACPVSIQILL